MPLTGEKKRKYNKRYYSANKETISDKRHIKKIWKETEPEVQHAARRLMIKSLTKVE